MVYIESVSILTTRRADEIPANIAVGDGQLFFCVIVRQAKQSRKEANKQKIDSALHASQ
jgi:hypothetical protein